MKPMWTFPVLMTLAACAASMPNGSEVVEPGILKEVPDSVRMLAAPGQDLSTVKIAPEDGCFYYLWNGPVESTFLPLRTAQGNPICTRTEG
ncbi:hypothetical protein [Jhaorihella thermophila]|uniref:Lipoprotein n=1 Tax=Jhaorihella thermophila TaxID=488547 RepID=A0A1H5UMQ3_9RHOB|nr:hypothetical protein [Jhaorihella thermophila]SEF76276.1 hypothetical protein SAMN05421751_104158 [Jhaorihella thermophila]